MHPLAGDVAFAVHVILDVGTDVFVRANTAIRIVEFGRADLFVSASEDVHVFEVFDLQAFVFRCLAFPGKRFWLDVARKLGTHGFVFFVLKVTAGKDDVGELRVLPVQVNAEEWGGRGAFVRVVEAVVVRGVTADVLQAADGAFFGEVAVINDVGVSRVNQGAVVALLGLVFRLRRGFVFARGVSGCRGGAITAAATSSGAKCYQDGQGEVARFHLHDVLPLDVSCLVGVWLQDTILFSRILRLVSCLRICRQWLDYNVFVILHQCSDIWCFFAVGRLDQRLFIASKPSIYPA